MSEGRGSRLLLSPCCSKCHFTESSPKTQEERRRGKKKSADLLSMERFQMFLHQWKHQHEELGSAERTVKELGCN
ncbi:hypothetical protein ATANTOWER_015566 [Ataeniobius toweri]|uniref:Uncharacterized protein n=1 Tax=Ataeniobius toweri TaxID=208326 RepID=A0ABU7C7T4_9TELE|nr:hypothetical protein [Ataeniobius toweri]